MRLQARFITRAVIIGSVDQYELIASYPEDKYLPSYLVFARTDEDYFHILFAVDVAENQVRVVTVYRPDPGEWDPALKSRRTAK